MTTIPNRNLTGWALGLILIASFVVVSGVFYLQSCQAPIRPGQLFSDMQICHANTLQARGTRCLNNNPQFAQNVSMANNRHVQMAACLDSDPSRIPFE